MKLVANNRYFFPFLLILCFAAYPAAAQTTMPAQQPRETGGREMAVTVGKSVVLESPVDIQRVSMANADVAEAVVVNPREVLVNGKAPGETTFIVWQAGGNRLVFDLRVLGSNTKIDAVRQEIREQLPGQNVNLRVQNTNVFLEGTVKDVGSAERAAAIAATLGKVINLLNVNVPPPEAQILLKVRFANVDRTALSDLAVNLLSTGATNTIARTTTGQFEPPVNELALGGAPFTFRDALNVFLFRRDINLAATIRALQNNRMLEILAEPNLLAMNGKPANFLAGGEYPYPTLQGGGAGLGAVTIQFREFGVRLNFLPVITPRSTIRLQVSPEVSALDFANGLIFQGFTIPALSTRRVQTEIELDSGQSFAIGGLLDNRIVENLSKIPGLGDIPLIGKLFQSRTVTKNHSELLVLVTPELVRPIPTGQPLPELEMPRKDYLPGATEMPRTPPITVTGPVPVRPPQETVPLEQLIQSQRAGAPQPASSVQYIPVPIMPLQAAPQTPPGEAPPQTQPVVPLPPPAGGQER